jgi:hypothetical protein
MQSLESYMDIEITELESNIYPDISQIISQESKEECLNIIIDKDKVALLEQSNKLVDNLNYIFAENIALINFTQNTKINDEHVIQYESNNF